MTEADLYKELGALTKDKGRWKESIPYVSALLTHDSVKIQAKALWLLGEKGLVYPQCIQDAVPTIASFFDSPEPLLRERAVNALGKIAALPLIILTAIAGFIVNLATNMSGYVIGPMMLFIIGFDIYFLITTQWIHVGILTILGLGCFALLFAQAGAIVLLEEARDGLIRFMRS